MAGQTFLLGETKVRPGVYVRVTNAGEPADANITLGTVMCLFAASWGPLGSSEVIDSNSVDEIDDRYGSVAFSPKADVAREALRGRALEVLCYRLGTGGTAASKVLTDNAGSPANVATVTAKYAGTLGNSLKLTVRDHPYDASYRQLLVYLGSALVQTITYTPGADEAQALVDAVAASDSVWITAAKTAAGDGTVKDIALTALASGADPTVDADAYADGLTAVEGLDWDVLATDSESASIHAAVQTYIDRLADEGKRVIGVVAEDPDGVAWETRLTNAAAYNDYRLVYVANGFKKTDGTICDGFQAAARVAGMIAGADITDSLTHRVITGATDLPEKLSNAKIVDAIRSGAIVFTFNAKKQVHVEYGINSFITIDADHDEGWKKIRRVRTRDNLMDRITEAWDPLVGQVTNNANGRAALMAVAQRAINQMVAEGALAGGQIVEDPAHPPAGDSCWFIVTVDDLDSAEKLYVTFGFSFAPSSAS